jgi:hypothetical protein
MLLSFTEAVFLMVLLVETKYYSCINKYQYYKFKHRQAVELIGLNNHINIGGFMRFVPALVAVAVFVSQAFAGPDTLPSIPILLPIHIIRIIFGF